MDQTKYDNLNELVRLFDEEDIEFTDKEKREFGEALMECMTPFEFHEVVTTVGDIYDGMFDNAENMEILTMWLDVLGFETINDYVEESDLDIPDFEAMRDVIMWELDEEEYINENYEDVLDMLPEQCEFNLSDEEICDLFEVFAIDPATEE